MHEDQEIAAQEGDAETPGGDTPDAESDGIGVDWLRRLMLAGFLRELVREEGRMEAAVLLGVNYKTLVRAEESGEITGRMGDALERLLGTGSDRAVERLERAVTAMEGRVGVLEDRIDALTHDQEPGVHVEGLETAVEAGAEHVKEEDGGAEQETDHTEESMGDKEAHTQGGTLRRPDPEVVVEEPADDDQQVYGDAWSLIREWRELRGGHPDRGRSLSWLVREERLLTLELTMLEEHGLTLPPAKEPLRGFGRRGQSGWRWKALADTRRALARRRMLRWTRRVCTLGLWR